jgi:hypothetical protein
MYFFTLKFHHRISFWIVLEMIFPMTVQIIVSPFMVNALSLPLHNDNTVNFVLYVRLYYAALSAAVVSYAIQGTKKLSVLLYGLSIAIFCTAENSAILGYLFPDLYDPLETQVSDDSFPFKVLSIIIYVVLGLAHLKMMKVALLITGFFTFLNFIAMPGSKNFKILEHLVGFFPAFLLALFELALFSPVIVFVYSLKFLLEKFSWKETILWIKVRIQKKKDLTRINHVD